MRLDRKGGIYFRISPGKDSHWDVNEKGVAKTLASFATEKGAFDYARDVARTRPGSKVIVEDNAV